MIYQSTILDCSPLIACVALFGIACGMIGYTLGRIHGYDTAPEKARHQ